MTESAAASPPAGRLGTFAGVFTPSILTILGIILFLRLGYVVGDAGLLRALAIIALANAVSVLTSWSLAAIATNLKVKGGGDYYLISRTLGPQFGGAIGIALFFAQSISIAFYAIGFAEGVTAVVDVGWLSERGIAALAIGPLFVLAWLGSDWATKFQFAIMAVLGLALLTFTIGAASRFEPAILDANWQPAGELPFWALFALFFPAVTGFTQGVSMSGELANPTRSLPLGTFLAVGLSTLIYFGVAVLFAGVAPGGELAADYEAMRHVSAWPAAITAGICAATLSSALASFLGAPRILQALANDRLFPLLGAFATVHPRTGNPRRAVLASVVIALATVALGDLNLVAPIVSMFFLISYGLLNYATWYEAHAGSPSFRPRFRWYHEHVSLAGCLVCAAMMFAIDPWAGGLALVVFAAVHQFLGRTVERARWNDSSRSALFQRVRRSLHAMGDTVAHDRDWRPVILAFTDEPARRARLLDFASWIEGGSGLTIAVQMVEGEGLEARRRRDELQGGLAAELEGREPPVFARVVLAGDPVVGFKTLVQAAGLGPIRPNVALFNWFDREGIAEDAPAMRAYGEYLRHALRFGCSVVVLAARGVDLARASSLPADGRRIDVWWNDDASSRLALLLSYLVTRTVEWDEAALRVLVPHSRQREVAAPEASAAAADTAQLERVRAFLDEVRIRADAVLVDGDGWERLAAASAGAALAFYPFRVRPHGPSDVRGEPLPSSLAGMPPLALVNAVHDLDLDAQPDEGPQAEAARAADALVAARVSAGKRRASADAAAARLADLRQRLAVARAGETADGAAVEALAADVERASDDAAELERKAVASAARVAELESARRGDPEAVAADRK